MESLVEARKSIGKWALTSFFEGISAAGKMHPQSDPKKHGVEVISNVRYHETSPPQKSHFHLLDIYRPINREGPLPVVLYVHGGAFRILSKDTHWIFALAFARKGYIVATINYRLAPECPFPAALEDGCHAYNWVVDNIGDYGGDLSQLVLAGESAGANLVTALSICATYARPEPYAQLVFNLNVPPKVVLPACGVLQVSDVDRFARQKEIPTWLVDRLEEVSFGYIGRKATANVGDKETELANPLLLLESDAEPARPLPAYFATCGTKDILIYDTKRLIPALQKHGAVAEAVYYPGEPHAFHALLFRKAAKKCWADQLRFTKKILAKEREQKAKL
ncbi:Carboxylesterase NlhH [Yarrowia sp. C11]|nr:Carboxylesterase NlhH [Yarrowia sp. C11]